ncbi:MAG: GNAT family N-acetyltransferase [Anaerolineaceae bacterium]|nr:GNAT family N-acetyltransferase [Anaerolineaceae bacterium]
MRGDSPMPGHDNPLLLDFPDSFETERLLIRAPHPGDGRAVNEAVIESLDNLRPWMPWAQTAPTIEENETFVRRAAAQFALREDLPLFLFRKADNRFVGGSGLHRIDWSVPHFEIGYWVRTSLEGQGYVTEAVHGIANFAFTALSAERVEIRCDVRNERSAAVARRAGFRLDGCLRHDARGARGELRDTYVFSKIRGE